LSNLALETRTKMKFFFHLGRYFLLLGQIVKRPEKSSIYRRQIILEIDNIGLQSLGIVAIISVFIGAVVAIQTSFNITNPLLPTYTVGFVTRQTIILEFSPTIISLILAGKIGSRIASEIGTMRVSEQIDALEIMGVNASGFLILPKVVASIIINPVLVVLSIAIGLFGGWLVAVLTPVLPVGHYLEGILLDFAVYDVFYALLKTVVFAFLITTISGYYGFYTRGGALEVGQASTQAVVTSSIFVIFFNLLLTQILLA